MRNFAEAGLNKWRVRHGQAASTDEEGNYGAFFIPIKGRAVAFVIASDGDECGWEHVSVHIRYHNKRGKVIMRTPSWEEMCFIKDLFWPEEELVVQYHPPKSEYVNNHEHCLHLWKPEDQEIPLPPSILTGIK